MKKTTQNRAFMAFLALIAVLFTVATFSACSNNGEGSDNDHDEKHENSIVGIWKLDATLASEDVTNTHMGHSPAQVYEVYKADGSYHKVDLPSGNGVKTEEGKYKVTDDELAVELEYPGGKRLTQRFKFKIDKDKMKKTNEVTEEIAKYTRFKENP